ncbi:AMP-binding protein [Armillaria fumosa]|nr:AMP-binding protein [Armillaria fumosa]
MDSNIIATGLRYIRRFSAQYPEQASSCLVASVHSFGPRVDAPFSCVHHAFDAPACARPTQVAIVDHLGHSLSYGELDSLFSLLASFSRARGVAAIFGILRAGAAYIPLDGDITRDEMLQNIMDNAQPAFVLVSKECISRTSLLSYPYGCIEDIFDIINLKDNPIQPVLDLSQGSDTAYVHHIHVRNHWQTKGGYGKPFPFQRYEPPCYHTRKFAYIPGVKVAQLLNIAFDIRADWIKVMKTGADPKDFLNATFYNCCGPTEVTTIVNTMHKHIPYTPLSIGKPTANNSVYILDEYLQPVPTGTPGAMWAGGNDISKGYLGLDELISKRYLTDPFLQGSKMYNTGDIGKWRGDGSLDHLGRMDDQGFRVELDGVSAANLSCPDVTGACTVFVGDELVGFYTPQNININDVQAAVCKILPWYSVPAKLIPVRSLSLTKNGKIDKVELKSIAISYN